MRYFFSLLASFVALPVFFLIGATAAMSAASEQALRILDETYFLHETRSFVRDMQFKGWTPAELSREEDDKGLVVSYVMKNSTLCVVTYVGKKQLPKEIVYIVAPADRSVDGPFMTESWSRDIEEVLAVAGAQLFTGTVGKGSPVHEDFLRELGPGQPALQEGKAQRMTFAGGSLRLESSFLQQPLAYTLKIDLGRQTP